MAITKPACTLVLAAEKGERAIVRGTCAENGGDVLTVNEVAQVLRMSRGAIYQMVARGQLPGFKVGRSVRVRREAIAKWIEAQE